jgi:hypothetical protein
MVVITLGDRITHKRSALHRYGLDVELRSIVCKENALEKGQNKYKTKQALKKVFQTRYHTPALFSFTLLSPLLLG